MGPFIIMLQHEVMVVDEWHKNRPPDFRHVISVHSNAINKMHTCSLSIIYACPYHNPRIGINMNLKKKETFNKYFNVHKFKHPYRFKFHFP